MEANVPPSPPAIQPQPAFYRYQLVGLVLILALPMMAVLGVFGESSAEISASNSTLAIRVIYTARHRYQMKNNLEIAVRNLSDQPISSLIVRIDNNYLNQFSAILFTPSITRITAIHHEIELTDLGPGESRLVTVEFQAEYYGEHRGFITALADEAEPVEVSISTFIFP